MTSKLSESRYYNAKTYIKQADKTKLNSTRNKVNGDMARRRAKLNRRRSQDEKDSNGNNLVESFELTRIKVYLALADFSLSTMVHLGLAKFELLKNSSSSVFSKIDSSQ